MSALKILLSAAATAAALSACTAPSAPAATPNSAPAETVLYNTADGYYYDQSRNRLPREYRPARHTRVERIDTGAAAETVRSQTTTETRADGSTVTIQRTVVQQPQSQGSRLTPSYYNQRAPIEGVRSNGYTHINGR